MRQKKIELRPLSHNKWYTFIYILYSKYDKFYDFNNDKNKSKKHFKKQPIFY